eukprot:jgi/Mesvir1/6534/Mv16796-RA.1
METHNTLTPRDVAIRRGREITKAMRDSESKSYDANEDGKVNRFLAVNIASLVLFIVVAVILVVYYIFSSTTGGSLDARPKGYVQVDFAYARTHPYTASISHHYETVEEDESSESNPSLVRSSAKGAVEGVNLSSSKPKLAVPRKMVKENGKIVLD